jgi:tripartite-type tricarboxylate transporter receptor subunit TctC
MGDAKRLARDSVWLRLEGGALRSSLITHHTSLILLCAALLATAALAHAQQYPSRPVRLVVPFTPGGSSDVVARLVAQKLAEFWGQQFVLDNRPGAGGSIGAETVARAAPDGYTILLTNPGPGLQGPLLRKKPSYALSDFAPIVYIGYAPNVVVAHPKIPAHTLRELVNYAKANPGRINWASPGSGSNPHIAMEMLAAANGIKVVHVPYKGASQAFTDLVAGQVDAQYTTFISAEQHVKAGRLKVLGVSGAKRQAALPDSPTFTEQGVKGADSTMWIGFVTAAAVPRPIIEKLNAGANKALQMPDVRARMEQLSVEIEGGTPEKFDAFIRSEAKRIAPLVKAGTLQID